MIAALFSNIKTPPCQDSNSIDDIDNYIAVKKEVERFKLPISYLDSSNTYALSQVVSSDLELVQSKDTPSMYEYLFKPKHEFAKCTMPIWREQYTTDVEYLKDTQNIIKNMGTYRSKMMSTNYSPNCNKVFDVWNAVKTDDGFLDKYSYMEWEMLKSFNHSSAFLQSLSLINIASPIISLCIPFLFVIFPFLILKIQGVPVTFSAYLDVLKQIAKNHFIGKALMNLQEIS
jgi:hypothetical protein